MGPILILDKSTFQALSKEEHVYLFKHFKQNLTPILAFEVLGDLAKQSQRGPPPESEVATLSAKFGGTGPVLNRDYMSLAWASLSGADVPMNGAIIPHEVFVGSSGGMLIEPSPINEAISRWAEGRFHQWEKQHAKAWRAMGESFRRSTLEERLQKEKVIVPSVATGAELSDTVRGLLREPSLQDVWFRWLLEDLVPSGMSAAAIEYRWKHRSHALLEDFAPYAHFCLRVFLSLVAAVRHRLVRWQPTLILDIQYLYYLPFCMAFTSGDKAHDLLAPTLLRPDQMFIRRDALKADLRRLADLWKGLDEAGRRRYSYAFDVYPSPAPGSVVFQAWKSFCKPWRPGMNLLAAISPEEAAIAIDEAREAFGRAGEPFPDLTGK